MHSVTKIWVLGILLCNTMNEIFPGLVGHLFVSASLDSKYILKEQTSPDIGNKNGLRPTLLSCLTKLSKPKDLDCKGRDKGCCLLVKLSQQRKKVMRRKNSSSSYNGSKRLRSKKYFEKYRQFWDEDQNFDFPRIIGEREEKNKNDIIQRVADGKLDFENSVYSTASSKLPVTTYYSKQNNYEGSPSLREDVYPSWKNEIDSFRQSTNKMNEQNPKGAMLSFSSGFGENDISDDIDGYRQSANKVNEPNLIRTVSFSSGFEDNDISDDVVKTPFKWAFSKQKKKRHRSNKGKTGSNFLIGNFEDEEHRDIVTKSRFEPEKLHEPFKARLSIPETMTPPEKEYRPPQEETETLFIGGQRRGAKPNKKKSGKEKPDQETSESTKKETLADFVSKLFVKNRKKKYGVKNTSLPEMLRYQGITARYDRQHCATLKVPCRFVSDHACCRFEMSLDLVARARSMDGSADLKWRNADHSLAYHIGGPRSGAEGRSLDWSTSKGRGKKRQRNAYLFRLGSSASYITPKNIKYNFANSKFSVAVPRYFYSGGPGQIKNLLATCWRLNYLKCPRKIWQQSSSLSKDNNVQEDLKDHPCCKLVSSPVKEGIPTHRISRWLS